MRRHFNPRLKVVKSGYWNVVASLHGVLVEDFEAIISLCEARIAAPYPEHVVIDEKPKHQEWRKAEYDRKKFETEKYHNDIRRCIAYVREHMTVVAGKVNVPFHPKTAFDRDPYNYRSKEPLKVRFEEFNMVLTSASLQWSEVYDVPPRRFATLSRINDFLLNKESEYGPPPPVDGWRIYNVLKVLDKQRQAMYTGVWAWPSPRNGGFGNVLTMDADQRRFRIKRAKEARKIADDWKKILKRTAREERKAAKKAAEEAAMAEQTEVALG